MKPVLRNLILIASLVFIFTPISFLNAAQVGIKYNRAKWEYPKVVLADFQRFQKDRIRTVMICLPWTQWEPQEGRLDEVFLKEKLGPVLKFCDKKGISVIISSHSVFWGAKGNWSIPQWVREKPGYASATSALTSPQIRAYHISYLNRLIDATRTYKSVVGYNILNEPVSATTYYLQDAKAEFDARWVGTLKIAEQVKEHIKKTRTKQFFIIGNGSYDMGYERYMWKNNGRSDLRNFWTREVGILGAQGIQSLIASSKWYPGYPKIRTEMSLSFAILQAVKKIHHDFSKLKTQWSPTADYTMTAYDYDSDYDFEGLANAAIPRLKAFYVWSVGTPDGSKKGLLLLDHRRDDRPTPYYWALRDLASGVDSFEAIDSSSLPQNGSGTLAFDPDHAKAGVSKRWSGSGTIEAQRENLPPHTDSRIAARITLEPGQFVLRSVIPAHWKDNGVTASDALVFRANAEAGNGHITLWVKAGEKELRYPANLSGGKWKRYQVSFEDLGLKEEEIGLTGQIGFLNESDSKQLFLIDEFLIRPKE